MPTVPPQYGGGRSFNFGDISSHGVAAVEVYKSANAVLPTGGLGSTINMVTAKPIGADAGGAISMRLNHHTKNVTGCLLYTSPSPRDRQKSRMPSSA